MALETGEKAYLSLVKYILDHGDIRDDRTGTGTRALFAQRLSFDLNDGFPLLTTKRVFWRGVKEELLWFLSGSTDESKLSEKKVTIWSKNGSREYLDSIGLTDRAEGDLGPVYGFQWRHFGAPYIDKDTDYTDQGIDQITTIIEQIQTNPHSRRIVLSAWNPANMSDMALPPCHMMCQFYVADNHLSCQMHQRSADMGLGVPFNIASYALLTHMIAHVCNLSVGTLTITLGDAHIYNNHISALQEQLTREPRPFPSLSLSSSITSIDAFASTDITLSHYDPHPYISMKMSV